jgi:hypothetical protein
MLKSTNYEASHYVIYPITPASYYVIPYSALIVLCAVIRSPWLIKLWKVKAKHFQDRREPTDRQTDTHIMLFLKL